MHSKSMVVFGLVFLLLFSGVIYIGTTRSNTNMDTKPVSEQPQNQQQPTEVIPETDQVTPEENVGEPATLPQGKIDVRVACESALMYTTFTDGASADAFVADCIEGKHPEVIERFISELGVDGATI